MSKNTKSNPLTDIYPDSAAGAVALLRDLSTLALADQPECSPDPAVEGVWLVRLDPETNDGCDAAIVYLAGYRNPWGVKRKDNDFEVGNVPRGADC